MGLDKWIVTIYETTVNWIITKMLMKIALTLRHRSALKLCKNIPRIVFLEFFNKSNSSKNPKKFTRRHPNRGNTYSVGFF